VRTEQWLQFGALGVICGGVAAIERKETMKTHFVALSRTTAILTGAWRRQLFALVVVLPGLVASAQITDVGGIARDFTVVNRADGQPLHLYDLVDQVVVLDFFA
jgi:hypothetical protein